MTHTVYPVLAALITFAAACERAEQRADAGPLASRVCQVALAPGPERGDIDRKISELQTRIRSEQRDSRRALEQLGHYLVARARLTNDSGDYSVG